jgi:hypothetical protein
MIQKEKQWNDNKTQSAYLYVNNVANTQRIANQAKGEYRYTLINWSPI